jgi:predicted amidohydrolase
MNRAEARSPLQDLLAGLQRANGNWAATAAVLWTWLEPRMGALGRHDKKPHMIRAEAKALSPFETWDDRERGQIEKRPLEAAAELLARLSLQVERDAGLAFAARAVGVDGTPVWVFWRQPVLAVYAGDSDWPPAADEHPSLATLTRYLSVCPVELAGITMTVAHRIRPTRGGRAAHDLLIRGVANACAPSLSVHLDPLQMTGMSGLDLDAKRHAGWFDERKIAAADEQACAEAACAAVSAAAGPPSVLVMPELAATANVERAIAEQLGREHEAPALTVVGLYHRDAPSGEPDPDAELDGCSLLAPHVNEAVVLAPDGSELWRHRKFSCAGALVAGDEMPFVESSRPGDKLHVVLSPIGAIAVVVCLDSFYGNGTDRLQRSGVDVLLVPSLSQSVLRHRTSLQRLVQQLWAIAFVCNRALAEELDRRTNRRRSGWDHPHNRSFWAIAHRPPQRVRRRRAGRSFVFRLPNRVISRDNRFKDRSSVGDHGGRDLTP